MKEEYWYTSLCECTVEVSMKKNTIDTLTQDKEGTQ